MGLRVLSLFDGISCGYVALLRAGIKVDVYDAYEIDENAIKISKTNFPQINHRGDVFDAKYTEGEYDLVIGGSPCTYWSIARTRGGREIENSGLGWDLFCQYKRAIKEVNPKYFLYENNYSISKLIKEEISKNLGVEYVMINSNLVSAQDRKRCYWTNIPINEIQDKNIMLYDVVDFENHNFREVGKWAYAYWGEKRKIDTLRTVKAKKSYTLTTSKSHPKNYYLSLDKKRYCNLSVNDWEKLQTLPVGYVDNVDVPQGSKYKAIGNGWTIDVIAHILRGIK